MQNWTLNKWSFMENQLIFSDSKFGFVKDTWARPISCKMFITQKYSTVFLFKYRMKKNMAACKLYIHKTSKLALQAYEVESSSQKDWTLHRIEYAERHPKCRLWFQMSYVASVRNLQSWERQKCSTLLEEAEGKGTREGSLFDTAHWFPLQACLAYKYKYGFLSLFSFLFFFFFLAGCSAHSPQALDSQPGFFPFHVSLLVIESLQALLCLQHISMWLSSDYAISDTCATPLIFSGVVTVLWKA